MSSSPTLTTAAVPNAAPVRLAPREAVLLSRFRRQLWKAPATSRARRAASPSRASSSFWTSHRPAGVGSVKTRSRPARRPALSDSVTARLLRRSDRLQDAPELPEVDEVVRGIEPDHLAQRLVAPLGVAHHPLHVVRGRPPEQAEVRLAQEGEVFQGLGGRNV